VDAVKQGLGIEIEVVDFREHALTAGASAKAAAYVEAKVNGKPAYGVGIDSNTVVASLKVSATTGRNAGLLLARDAT
jgi:2-isopropylmalate synthase